MERDFQHKIFRDGYFNLSEAKKFRTGHIAIGGETKGVLERNLFDAHIIVSPFASSVIHSKNFILSEDPQEINVVRVSGSDLGVKSRTSLHDFFKKAYSLGLAECPVETAIFLRIADTNQRINTIYSVATKPIHDDFDQKRRIFRLANIKGILTLQALWPGPTNKIWSLDEKFVFKVRN